MNSLLDALAYGGDLLDKSLGGRAVRGLAYGRPDELASILPFSDTLGITDPSRRVSGEDLVTGYGLAAPGSWGATLGGIGAEILLDPATLATGGLAAFKGLRGLHAGLDAAEGGSALARRLAELKGPSAVDRQLGELASSVPPPRADPFDALRGDLRAMGGGTETAARRPTFGPYNPAADLGAPELLSARHPATGSTADASLLSGPEAARLLGPGTPGAYEFNRLASKVQGQGGGGAVLADLLGQVDQHGLPLVADLNPTGDLGLSGLADFYGRRGFVPVDPAKYGRRRMVYEPTDPRLLERLKGLRGPAPGG
jgi:hypothetical protein